MTDIEGEGFERPTPQKTKRRSPDKKPPSEVQRQAFSKRADQLRTVGRILPECPMTPDELADTWKVGSDDVMSVSVVVLRQIIGKTEQELLESVPLIEYSANKLAGKYGPGRYYIKGSGGPYRNKCAVLPISESMARENGWGRIPVTAQDATAARTIEAAMHGPTDPLDLLAAVERLIDRKLEGIRGPVQIQGQQPAEPFDPMKAMQSQMNQMTAWMMFMDDMEARTQARVMKRLNLDPEPEPKNNQSLLEALLPVGLKLAERIMAGPPAAPAPAPAPAPAIRPQPTLPPPQQATQPNQPAAQQATATEALMQQLTAEERQALGQAWAGLQPFGATLVQLASSTGDDDQIVAELEGWIPGNMEPAVITLATIAQKHGPAVLEKIHPGLAMDRWVGILGKLAKALQ